MEPHTIAQELAIIANAPIVTIIAVVGLIIIVGKFFDFANRTQNQGFKEQLEGLREQMNARTAQRDLALDRLQRANEELATAEQQLAAERERHPEIITTWATPPSGDAAVTIGRVIAANTATGAAIRGPTFGSATTGPPADVTWKIRTQDPDKP